MDVLIERPLSEGTLEAVPSKSLTHRALIAAGLSTEKCIIKRPLYSDDTIATITILRQLGVEIKQFDDHLEVNGSGIKPTDEVFFANESGSTLRFLVPVALLSSAWVTFDGMPGLRKRPLSEYISLFKQMGLQYELLGENLPIKIKGPIVPGDYHLRGDVSSQFIN